jgi:hypothetical protein
MSFFCFSFFFFFFLQSTPVIFFTHPPFLSSPPSPPSLSLPYDIGTSEGPASLVGGAGQLHNGRSARPHPTLSLTVSWWRSSLSCATRGGGWKRQGSGVCGVVGQWRAARPPVARIDVPLRVSLRRWPTSSYSFPLRLKLVVFIDYVK